MFRSLSSKNSASSSKRKKTDQSSRRTESVTSSSTNLKQTRNDERSSKSDRGKQTSTQPPVDGPSGLSSYYTTSDRLDQLEPRSLTEEAIRSLGMQDDGWGDTYSHAEDLPSRAGIAKRREHSNATYKTDTGRRYNEGLEYRPPTEEDVSKDRSNPHGDYAQNSFGTSSHVQDQFPGQDPSTFARSAFNPTMTQGVATEGAAAEYYSQAPMQRPEIGTQHVTPQAFNAAQSISNRPAGQTDSLMSYNSAYPAESYTTAPTNGSSDFNTADQNYTYHQPHHPTESYVQANTTSHESYHQHSQSVPSATTYTDPAYITPLFSQIQGHGEHASTGQNLPYITAAEATMAGTYNHHHHKTHQHNHSVPVNNNSHGNMYGYSSSRPYTSGAMATQHKHKGPVSKFVDWWKDHEDVRKMEEYTEYIGVCKYCFDPRSTATEAPRKHYRGGRRSSESLRRRSSDSLRRSYTNGSKYGRVDKDARYHSSDSERRSNKSSWLGASVAAYGLSKVGKSLWQSSRDFDDTYSVKSGRKSDGRRESSKNNSSGHNSKSERNSDRFEIGAQNPHRRSEYTGSESRRSQDGRYSARESHFVTAGGSRHTDDQIQVRHPSPGAGHLQRHTTTRSGYKSRSRSQSPSLAQILGLTSSQKRTSATASQSFSPQQDGMFTGFFSKQPSKNKSKQSKKKGFFNFNNSSSSSTNSDLAFGVRATKNDRLTKRPSRKTSDEHLKATLLGVGVSAAALSAVQRSRSGSKKVENMRPRSGDHRHTTQRSKQNTSEEDGWESATDDESVSSGLAFGDFDTSRKGPRRQRSSESITSQSSGTDKWSWRWRRKSDKKDIADDMPQTYRDEIHTGRDTKSVTSQPLRYVHPAPIPSPMHSDARNSPAVPGAFPEQPCTINVTPIQQPQPIMPLHPSIFGTQTLPENSLGDQYTPQVSARSAIPGELRRTQSSPVSSHTMRNAAIAGMAGAAAAGILSNGKGRARDDSPSNVRFELTEKQAKKEERQQRKDTSKESKDRAKEDNKEKKERARLDRERAMQEDSDRKTAEDARRYTEEADRQRVIAEQAERHQARLREVVAVEAREREADRQREKEIKDFIDKALAEQAREAEQKKQREAWQAQQMAAVRQDSPPSSRAGPFTSSRPEFNTPSEYRRDNHEHRQDRSELDRDGSDNVKYATRSYEPSNEHSGQPLMDDDLIDPDFFTRRRSHSDLARHDELARKAAAKIVADLKDRYSDPVPSQAEFFAPKELSEPSQGKTKVRGPIDDTDYRVYHMSEDQIASMPNEPPPPYQPSYQFANVRDKKGPAPWDIPKLNVIAPTPPASYAGSAKDDKSPISASREVGREANKDSDARDEVQKSSKISWGEDQTRFYEIATPESSQEHVVLPDEFSHGASGLRTEYVNPGPSQAESDNNRHMANDPKSKGYQPDAPVEEITRDVPYTNSERFYQQPFVESVDDIAFTLDSPGTEGAPPVQGFVEGEVEDVNLLEDQMPHFPGGFDDVLSDHRLEDISNNDVQDLDREAVRDEQPPREQDQDDYFMTKKQRKRRDKEARRAALEGEERPPADTHRTQDNERPSALAEAGVLVGTAAAVGVLMHNERSRSPTRRKSEPEDFDRQRPHSSHSEPRETVSQSTPTSPVYERRPSLPSHAFDDLDMLPGSKRPKKSKRNSLLNYPAVGSPLRSAVTWDEYIGPLGVEQHAQSQSLENDHEVENPLDETPIELRREFPSPESEIGAQSIVSAPAGDEDSGRRRKSKKSHRERDKSTSPRRSASVAASEPIESSRKHKRRSQRDEADLDDASSIRSRSSHSSKRDDEESKTKKKGGILSLFRRKTSDDVASKEQKRTDDDERSKHHRRRQSSEHAIDEFSERRDSTSRSCSHADGDGTSSRHSSSSRHRRRHHRDGSVDNSHAGSRTSESGRRHKHRSRDNSRSPENEFDDTQSQTSESRRKHRHRERDLDLDDRMSLSRDSKTIEEDGKSFLVERVEDEESVPLPEDDSHSSPQAQESIEQPLESILSPDRDKMDSTEQVKDSILSPTSPDEPVSLSESTVPEDSALPMHDVEEAQSSTSPSEALSPPLEHMTPARPIVPLRVSSSTAVPLRFRRPPTSPSLPKERSASFSSSVVQSPSSPITPKGKRPLSTEFMHSTEFRPLYLLERTRKPQDQEAEQNLPSLPPSRSTSSSSLQSSEDWQSAAEDFDPSEHDNSSPPDLDQLQTEESEDILGSAQTTPKATEFPKHVFESRPHLEPEYYSWSDMEREEHIRQAYEQEHPDDPAAEPVVIGDGHHAEPLITNETIKPSMDIEVNVNQDPMASDVWGDLSDEELPDTEAPIREEPSESAIRPEEADVEPSFTVSAKKRKNKKAAKLGTVSIAGPTSPIRETPAELARRREKDAQDAVDTWFKPAVRPTQETPVEEADASLMPLPDSPTSTIEKSIQNEFLPASVQGGEASRQEIEPSSLLLSRKKSKKGKKKQKSMVLNEPATEPLPTEEPPAEDMGAEDMPGSESTDHQSSSEHREVQTPTDPDLPVFVPKPNFETSNQTAPIDVADESFTPISPEQPFDDALVEEPSYTMSKAERKKQSKKAKKAVLSIAVPAVAAAVLATSEWEAPEQNDKSPGAEVEPTHTEDREDEILVKVSVGDDMSSTPGPADDHAETPLPGGALEHALLSAEPEPVFEPGATGSQGAAVEPIASSGTLEELLPEETALPVETQNDLDELAAIDPVSEPTTDTASQEEQAQLESTESPEKEFANSAKAIPEIASKRSSWFSWLPGSRTQEADETKADSKDHAQEPDVLTQEPFERLLEQPIQHPGFVDEPSVSRHVSEDTLERHEIDAVNSPKDIETLEHDENTVKDTPLSKVQPQLEEDQPLEPETSTDNTEDAQIQSTTPIAQVDPVSDNATSNAFHTSPTDAGIDTGLHRGISAEVPEKILGGPEPIQAESQEEILAVPSVVEPEPVEDFWAMPTKKGKKGKKAKKAAKETVLSDIVPPSSSTLVDESLDIRTPTIEDVEPIEGDKVNEAGEPILPSDIDIQGSSDPAVTDEQVSATLVSDSADIMDLFPIPRPEAEDVSRSSRSAPEFPEIANLSVEPAAQDTAQDADTQIDPREVNSHAKPSTAIAEDEWAIPSSKKKKKKGKRGRQSYTEFLETAEDVPITDSLEPHPLESITKTEDAPVTPDVFETPAEGNVAQYFATPAEELADQYFATPMEEVPEQPFADFTTDSVPMSSTQGDEADLAAQEQLRRSSITPTQETTQDELARNADEPLSTEEVREPTASGTTHAVHGLMETGFPNSLGSTDEVRNLEDESRLSPTEHIADLTPKPTFEQPATTEKVLVDTHVNDPEQVQPENTETSMGVSPENDRSAELEATNGLSPIKRQSDDTSQAVEQPQSQNQDAPESYTTETTDLDAFVLTSSKKSKKDKKKTKKAKQQESESEFFQPESAGFASAALEEPSEPGVEIEPETSVAAGNDTTSTFPQLPEAEPVIEDPLVTRKLSKKEKRKAKKSGTSGFASPFEDTPEQTPLAQGADSYFPDTAEREPTPEATQVDPQANSNIELETAQAGSPEQTRPVAEVLSNDQLVPIELQQLNTDHESHPDKADRDVSLDAPLTTLEPVDTEEPTGEIELTRDYADADVADVVTDESVPLSSLIHSDGAHTDDQEISKRSFDPEPAVVEDQAPSVLDQLILSEDLAPEATRNQIDSDEVFADMPTVRQNKQNILENEALLIVGSSEGSQILEGPTNTTEAQEEPVEGAEEPMVTREFEQESEVIQESMVEEDSVPNLTPVPVKLSKKEARKAKKSKQTELAFESSEPEETKTSNFNSVRQLLDENAQAETEAYQMATEIADDTFSHQLSEDIEPFTAKLSKKAKKKAKKSQAKAMEFDAEEEDQFVSVQEMEPDIASAENRLPEDPSNEPLELPSIGPIAQKEPEIDQEFTTETSNPLWEDITQGLINTKHGPDDVIQSGPSIEDKSEAVGESENTHVSPPVCLSPDRAALINPDRSLSQDISLDPDFNDETIPRGVQDIYNEVTLMAVSDQNETDILGNNEQPSTRDAETPISADTDESWTPISTSKKKNKKEKRVKLQQEFIEPNVVNDEPKPDLPNVTEEPTTQPVERLNDEPVLAGADEIVEETAEEQPSISAADEWALPTKQSKKEKRKAKKLKDVGEPLIDENVQETPVTEDVMQGEIIKTQDQPSSHAAGPEAPLEQSQPVAESAVNEDWSFFRKPSKKEKRKAKKTTFNDEQHTEETLPEEKPPASDPVVVVTSPIEPINQVVEDSRSEDIHRVPSPDNPSQDIDFAATLAAGLQDSGFDPSLVIDDPVFHRRASPTSVGEADPGEITSTTMRRPKRSSNHSRAASPVQETSKELSGVESLDPAEESSKDDFSDALTAGLLASGFAPNALAHLSTVPDAVQDEPEEFAFAMPKKKKKGKKATRAETITPEVQVSADKAELEDDRHDIETVAKSMGEPTDTSPTRLAKPTFFHTSEVSQFLPVRIDHPVQSDEKLVDRAVQPSVDASMVENSIEAIPIDSKITSNMEQSQKTPAIAMVQSQPETWSFDNLESPAVHESPELNQDMQNGDPSVSSRYLPREIEQAAQADSISPVDSTTKDRTSYLFQSPINLNAFKKVEDMSQQSSQKQTRFYEPKNSWTSDLSAESQKSPAPLPSSPPENPPVTLPSMPLRVATPPTPLPPSPSHQSVGSPIPMPPTVLPVQSPPLTRNQSLFDIGSPGPGHASKAARRTATPQQSFRDQVDASQLERTEAVERDNSADTVPNLRPMGSSRSMLSNKEPFRSTSSASNHSAAPSLRRVNRSLSGDLRAASSRRGDATHGPTTIPIEPPPTPPLQDEEFNGHGAFRSLDMANIYVCNLLSLECSE
jgi:hypothetical protein